MNVGIDIGYRATKIVWRNGEGLHKVMFPSIVGTPDQPRFSLNDEDTDIIIETEEDGRVLVGQGAIEQSRFQQRREDRGWLTSSTYRQLLAAVLTEVTDATSVNLNIVTGLPVAFYEGDRQKQCDIFQGEHVVRRANREHNQRFHVTQVRSIPQPFGTLFSEALNEAGQFTNQDFGGQVGIVDIGGKTTNILSVLRMREIARETASVNVGGWDVVQRVQEYLGRRCPGLELRDHEVAEALIQKSVRYYGQTVDLTGIIGNVASDLLEQVIGEASKLWNGAARLDVILITGGGALLLGDPIVERFRQARIVEDAVFANCLGYHKLSNRETQ